MAGQKAENRCWPGYEPVPGKPQHSQGSCRPKAESKTTSSEKKFRAKRRKQLDKWQAEHPRTRKSASQHLSAPGSKKASAKKAAAKKRPAKKTASKSSAASAKRASSKKTPSKKTASRRSAR